MKHLTIAFLFISSVAFSQKPVKHDTTYVLEVDPAFWQKLQYVVSKSNAEHLTWADVNEYLNPADPKKNHIKVVVDSVIKK